ncbi:hypothetical protein KKG45_10155 [bacterium]|nr:hypothetical protein [bacterium]MBU1073598.1 hypothetical protein [bacterium]MBU1676385.1 hypothetical protein [bacterium]
MRLLTIMLVLTVAATGAMADQTLSYGWEDGVGTAHGIYGNVGGTVNVGDFSHSGDRSLYTWEEPLGGTPQVYLAWITGLQLNDVVNVDCWVFDDTPDPDYYPRFRLWGHYSTNDINDYAGTASGLGPYTTGIGWENIADSWTYGVSGTPDPDATALVIEFRIYSGTGVTPPGDTDTWVDDITITAPDNATIYFPDREPVGNEDSSWGAVKNLFR